MPFRRVIFIILPLTHTLALNKSHKEKTSNTILPSTLSLSRSRAIRQFNPRHFRLANCAPLAATLPPLRSSLVLVLVKSRSVFRPLRTADYRPAATTRLSSLTSARPVRVLLLGTALGGNSGAELILKSLRTTLIFFPGFLRPQRLLLLPKFELFFDFSIYSSPLPFCYFLMVHS